MIALKRQAMGATAGSAALLVGALCFQYLGGLAPCHLCLLQRWPHAIAILIGLLILALPRRGLALVAALVLVAGAGIAAYHVGVEQHWWAGPTSCTAPEPGSLSAADLLRQIEATPVVACDQIAWSLFGISMAGWNLLASLALAVLWLRAYASSTASQ